MIKQFIFISAFLFLNATNAFSQLDSLETELSKYAYPIILYTSKGDSTNGTGFFIKSEGVYYLITTHHALFYQNTKKQMGFSELHIIFNSPASQTGAFILPLPGTKVINKCSADVCIDFLIIPIIGTIPKSVKLNHIEHPFNYYPDKSSDIYIVGFPKKKINIVKTKIKNWGDGIKFSTIKSSDKGGSGSPVFSYSQNKLSFVGLYIGGDRINGILTTGYGIKVSEFSTFFDFSVISLQ